MERPGVHVALREYGRWGVGLRVRRDSGEGGWGRGFGSVCVEGVSRGLGFDRWGRVRFGEVEDSVRRAGLAARGRRVGG